MWDVEIKNGTLVHADRLEKANVYIKDGKIAAVSATELPGAEKTIDASGQYVFPGFIDTHVHSRDPGGTHKEDFAHSTRAAAAGGITSIFEMPNTKPPVDNPANFDAQKANLSEKAFVDFGLWGICLGHLNNDQQLPLAKKGVIGLKFFWGYAVHQKTFELMYNYKPGMEDVIPPFTDGEVYEMFEHAAKTDKVFAIHAENSALIQQLTARVEARGGKTYRDLLEGRPSLAESLTIETGISMARATGARLHILHISTKEGVELVRKAQQEGLPITGETCPHYLFLHEGDYEKVGPKMKVYPPVKFKEDQDALWEGLADGTLSHVCSDHAPHTAEEKDGDLWSIPAGMCGVESLAPLMLNAVSEGRLELTDVSRLLAEGPAKLFGVDKQKGTLAIGSDADVTIVDMNVHKPIVEAELHSKSKVTAYDGFPVKGWPVMTIVRGHVQMAEGQLAEKECGQLILPDDLS
ncbi:allantoinase AllB [Bacillaceae bacterium SIJ1]|uniref:allantoinase AllB n=1 Tax=Litoribacterium kuwaitense TaxID=1398745 RepID=UPI0013ED68D3|nr:allantoinase AllB [Litoribacterium kuwaitense]NGP44851.1 allantoinase AllB [Litoribacterium kuwaitense]